MGAERAAQEIAQRQHGVIDLADLLDAGLSETSVRRRVDSGWLTRIHPGIFCVGEPSDLGKIQAALLACGPASIATAQSAAAMDDLLPHPAAVFVATHRNGARPKGVQVSRPRELPAWYRRHGLRLTTPAETLLALAATATYGETLDATNQAFILRRTNTEQLRAFLDARGGRRGASVLREIVEGPRTRSHLERIFFKLLKDAGLPLPQTNVRVNGHLVDFYWPEHRLVVETDGWAPHGRREQWERDHQRDLDLFSAGIQTLRVTYVQVTRRQLEVVAGLAVRLRDVA